MFNRFMTRLARLILAAGVAFVPILSVFGEEPTRAGIATATRKARLQNVQTAKPSWFVSAMKKYEEDGLDRLLTYQKNHFTFGLLRNSPFSEGAPGIRYEIPRIGSSDLTLWISGAYSVLGLQGYELLVGKFDKPLARDLSGHSYPEAPFDLDFRAPNQPQSMLYFDAEFRTFPDENFYGLGTDSEETGRTKYSMHQTSFGVVGGHQIFRGLAVLGRVDYLRPNVSEPRNNNYPSSQNVFSNEQIPGLLYQPAFFRYRGSIVVAHYNDPFQPSGLVEFLTGRYEDLSSDQYSFTRYELDTRGYLPLGSRQRVLAARFLALHDDPDKDNMVPFYLMDTLGGPETLRGYKRDRFRDLNLLYMSAEYRWEGAPGLELAVFYDTGKVFPDLDDFDFQGLKHTYGAGLRFKKDRRTTFRIDFGRSKEGIFGYLSFAPAF